MFREKKVIAMFLAMALLLAGCGGGPSAAEGAEPSGALPPSTAIQTPEVNGQDVQNPQISEPASDAEIAAWKSVKLVNSNVIVAEGTDGTCAILDSNGTVQKTLSECTSVSLVNQYCFSGQFNGTYHLYDLTGTVILTGQTGFSRALPLECDDPFGVIMYEVSEQSDFGGKTSTHFMRTDNFEDIYQVDGNRSGAMGMLRYDGVQYLVKKQNTDLGKDSYFTLDGTELPEYQEADPFAARTDFSAFLSGLGYQKTTVVGNGIGGLGITGNNATDIYNRNHELCASYDSQIQLSPDTPVGNLGLLATYTSAAGYQTGVFDFQTGSFLLTVEGSTTNGALQPKVVHDTYSRKASAFLLGNTTDLHTLVCQNGSLIENVDFPAHLYLSSFGYALVTSTAEPDRMMIVNVETGEIESEFQAHLS